ncbi:IclR family transcriptional regulator [Amycolatopsis pithecellobii]|uniref:Helix-turn-helix domain-containing protein n=1 Tax=Amycolatopsis pithecellobii TaxID=664692 RepID=A0A6N7Z3L2_9PSEU|nr:IclR family transcriptional regulator [Amycolatopsis pithecellobii]MTD54841.1 helix-turn-helix domain-containing protein [Amycolatopsis pithecellobii]
MSPRGAKKSSGLAADLPVTARAARAGATGGGAVRTGAGVTDPAGSGLAGGVHVDRALDVLEWLAQASRDQGRQLSDVATGVEHPKASVHRALAILRRRGYVLQDDHGNYALGIKCHELGQYWTVGFDLRFHARPVLEALNQTSLETVHLAVYDQGDVVYVDKLESLHQVVVRPDIGNRAPAVIVATGLALLAFQPELEIKAQLTRPLPAYTEQTPQQPDEIAAILAEVRRDGYAVNRETYRRGVCGVAAPIRDTTGAVVASIGLVGPSHRFTAQHIAALRKQVVASAVEISMLLGGPDRLVTSSEQPSR